MESSKCNEAKEMDAISKYHIPKSFMGGIFPYLYLFFYNIVCILTSEFNFNFSFFGVKLRGITKEAFVAYAIQFALEHHQLFTHHHATKSIKTTTKYHTIMGIPFSSSLEEE